MGITNIHLRVDAVVSEGLTTHYSFLSVFGMMVDFVDINMMFHGFFVYSGS